MKGVAKWFLATIFCAASSLAATSNGEAEKTIALTRETRGTYSVFFWNVITRPGNPVQAEWSAEFHKGALHRVETPRDRVVANCEKGTGTYLNVESGERIEGPKVAKAACGIQANSRILETRFLGTKSGKWGRSRSVWIRDPENIRTYSIADSGAIIFATIDDLESRHLLRMAATYLYDTAPDNIFSAESLARSAVAEKYRKKP